jgi:hypothetical protein
MQREAATQAISVVSHTIYLVTEIKCGYILISLIDVYSQNPQCN